MSGRLWDRVDSRLQKLGFGFIILSALGGSSVSAKCREIVHKAAEDYLNKWAEPSRVLPAAKFVYAKAIDAGMSFPDIVGDKENIRVFDAEMDAFDKTWSENLPNRVEVEITTSEKPLQLLGAKGEPLSVQEWRINGEHLIFRPLLKEGESDFAFMQPIVLRGTVAATKLSRLLNLNTVPDAKIGRLNGQLGVISPFVESEPIQAPFDKDQFDSVELAEAMTFEFIAGNRDDRFDNIRGRRRIRIIDHKISFCPNIPNNWDKMPIGSHFADFYPKHLIDRLKEVGVEELNSILRDELKADLHPGQIDHIYLRIQMILKDAEDHPDLVR